jgi:hypothetical protein
MHCLDVVVILQIKHLKTDMYANVANNTRNINIFCPELCSLRCTVIVTPYYPTKKQFHAVYSESNEEMVEKFQCLCLNFCFEMFILY